MAESDKIVQKFMAVLGQDGFWVELYSVYGEKSVTESHDRPILGGGVYFQAIGQILLADNQRVVAGHLKLGGESLKQSFLAGANGSHFPVHGPGAFGDPGIPGVTDDLVAEADP